MGVKDLWNILGPSCEKKSLWELNGLTIAIDLSSWIVDSQNIGEGTQLNMYLRNLFFRTSYLLLLGVKPIFILEGKAPVLKHDTIAKRMIQHRSDEHTKSKNNTGSRGRLNCLQKRCEELLKCLGVKCYKSDGEAEALCSKLNEMGVVDAVISQDSDCFLYGARVVLRNFTMSPAYTCDMYTMEDIETKLGLGRQKLLALSLLCGCDYDSGVQGIGKQSALKFLATLRDDQVLDRLRKWRNDDSSLSRSQLTQMTQEEKLEYNIRKKAVQDPRFPSEEVISEFLSNKSVQIPSFVWSKPSLPNFMMLADRMLAWEEDYTRSKFVPLVTRWHLQHGAADPSLTLEAVVKQRAVRGVACYELRWRHDGVGEVTSVEPRDLVAQTYPDLHDTYLKSKQKPKKGTRGKMKKTQDDNNLENLENKLENLDISGRRATKPRTKIPKGKCVTGLQTLDKYFLVNKNIPHLAVEEMQEAISNPISCSTPIRQEKITPPKSYHLSDNSNLDTSQHENAQKTNTLPNTKSLDSTGKNVLPINNSDTISNDLPSFLDSTVDSYCAFDLSDIVNSIVTRPCPNPAIAIWASKQH